MLILGVDPGASGAIALYDTSVERITKIWDMPTKAIKVGTKERHHVCPHGVYTLLWESGANHIAIEQVGGMPGQSGAASFVFGAGYGILWGVAAALNMEINNPAPILWKAKMKVPREKHLAAAKATEIIPYFREAWKTKARADRAEAALIALYARRHVWTKEMMGV